MQFGCIVVHPDTCLLASHNCLVAPIYVLSQLAVTDDWACTARPSCMLTATPAWQLDCQSLWSSSQGRTYTIESNIDSSAEGETVLDVLTDYPSHPEVFSSIHSSRVVTRDENEAHILQVSRLWQPQPCSIRHVVCFCIMAEQQWHFFLQEGRWNVLWLSGRFQTLVRMREDFPKGRVTSRSLKSTVFASHDGEWEASGICPLRSFSIPVYMHCFFYDL